MLEDTNFLQAASWRLQQQAIEIRDAHKVGGEVEAYVVDRPELCHALDIRVYLGKVLFFAHQYNDWDADMLDDLIERGLPPILNARFKTERWWIDKRNGLHIFRRLGSRRSDRRTGGFRVSP